MTADLLRHFREVWALDFEFNAPPGERQSPICLVAVECRSGRLLRIWEDELATLTRSPIPVDDDVLSVAYYSSAEWCCYLALGWELPIRILDLFCEFRVATNGLRLSCGNGLLGALAHFGIKAIGAGEKDSHRDLAIRGGAFTDAERVELLDYCESDVRSLEQLLPEMMRKVDLPRALLRGRYMATAARMEATGTPIDVETLDALRANWVRIKGSLIEAVDRHYAVYVPTGVRPSRQSSPGQQIFAEAYEWGLDPARLADTATAIWQERREATRPFTEAVAVARKTTGLTRHQIERWENSGRDYSTWPRLDTQARELASMYPELGIGRGYETGTGEDINDYGSRLWDLLRNENRGPRRYDPEIIQDAAERLAKNPESDYTGPMSFSSERFADYLVKHDIPWPRTESGQLSLSGDTFREMARTYPQVAQLRELRHSLGEMRLESLAVGSDARNRCLLSAFRARSGRNAPSNSKHIFGPSCWLRGLIKPERDRAVAYIDWSQQEIGIAAALSGDQAMREAYLSGDCYLTFAKQAGAVPESGTKESHPEQRALFKTCMLGVGYGMGSQSLAFRISGSEAEAAELLRLHRRTYATFWQWSDSAVDHAMFWNRLDTVFGWPIHLSATAGPNPRSLGNFPMQANGAEMLRLACCLATERGISVCAPVHDAVMIEAAADEIESAVAMTQDAMAEASRAVLDGFTLRTDAEIVRWPDRYMDPRGQEMWGTIMGILAEIEVPFWPISTDSPAQDLCRWRTGGSTNLHKFRHEPAQV